ncbi:MAG TPA: hypothetical protein VF444_01990 [Pseudonocardiaceae bacterium]
MTEPEPTDSADAEPAAIADSSGTFTDCYADNYLDELRQEWPD